MVSKSHCLARAIAKSKNNKGFTLIETMVGMMIFAVGISAVLYMEVVAINGHSQSREFVSEVQQTIMQVELIGPYFSSSNYNDDEGMGVRDAEDGDAPHPALVGSIEDATASYYVHEDTLVQGLKMITMTNRREPDARPYTLHYVEPAF